MPSVPTQSGLFIPNGYLNLGSFAGPSGQQDAYGQNYPTATTPGKVIFLTPNEATVAAAPTTTLYDGAYQVVKLDSGATASLATNGLSAWVRSGSSGPQTAFDDYGIPVVTTADEANTLGSPDTFMFAGIFINPATVSGVANTPTPGQYIFIFTGKGRATVTYDGNATAGNQVLPLSPASSQTGEFHPAAAGSSVYPGGVALATTTSGAGGQGVALFRSEFSLLTGQGV